MSDLTDGQQIAAFIVFIFMCYVLLWIIFLPFQLARRMSAQIDLYETQARYYDAQTTLLTWQINEKRSGTK